MFLFIKACLRLLLASFGKMAAAAVSFENNQAFCTDKVWLVLSFRKLNPFMGEGKSIYMFSMGM